MRKGLTNVPRPYRKRRGTILSQEQAFYDRWLDCGGIRVSYRHNLPAKRQRTFYRAFNNTHELTLWWRAFRDTVTILDEQWPRMKVHRMTAH